MSDQETGRVIQSSLWRDMPPGIPYIVGNEAAERFSFYGMKAILFVYMTKYLMNSLGQPDPMEPEAARESLHWFVASAYFFPVIGAVLSDWLLGKYRTILWLSLVYCLGHLALAAVPGRFGLLTGLTLIAMGAGGIKPCVSAHVGDQFSEHNKDLLPRVFSWFYFSINFGAFFSTIITPILLEKFGPHWGPHVAFGLPGLLMLVATFVFWLGRHKFVHVKPGGIGFIRETFSADGIKALTGLIPLFLFVAIFWALYDQTASAWVEQADSMDRNWLGIEWLSSQIQAINPVLVLVLIPACTYGLYPALNLLFRLTPLRKVAIGFAITAFGFGISGAIETQITGGKIIRNASIEQTGSTSSVTKEQPLPGRELIIRLREHRSWNVKSISWVPAQNETDPSTSLTMRVEVGETPKGPWKEQVTRDFNTNLKEVHTIDLVGAVSTKFVRIIIVTAAGVSKGENAIDSIQWNKDQTVKVIAAESSPPEGSGQQAAAVWPDVAAVGYRPSIFWQLVGYLFLTLAEVMVSITCLEFSYTQAPNKMKSVIMSLYLLSVSLGNALTALVNMFIQNTDGTSKLPGSSYYWFFTGLMILASLGFLAILATYREKTYIQSQADAE